MYDENIWKFFLDPNYKDLNGSFKLLNKTGEVYAAEDPVVIDGYLENRKDRSRAIMTPSRSGYGPLQALQSYLFPWLRKHVPSFIHGLTSAGLKDHIIENIKKHYKSICLDGSAFDSS